MPPPAAGDAEDVKADADADDIGVVNDDDKDEFADSNADDDAVNWADDDDDDSPRSTAR